MTTTTIIFVVSHLSRCFYLYPNVSLSDERNSFVVMVDVENYCLCISRGAAAGGVEIFSFFVYILYFVSNFPNQSNHLSSLNFDNWR